jgi:hypothetical protein
MQPSDDRGRPVVSATRSRTPSTSRGIRPGPAPNRSASHAFDGGTGKLPLCAGHPVLPHLITLLARACSNGGPVRPRAIISPSEPHPPPGPKPVAEKKVQQLPPGPLFWRIDNFPTLAQAQAAAGPTGLAAEVAGKVWLFTLGPKGGSSPGGSKVTEIGPVPPITAPEYLLRINNTGGPPGVKTPVHTHPGSETFYVLSGQLSQKSPHGASHVDAGQSIPGHGPGMPMEVSSSGTTDMVLPINSKDLHKCHSSAEPVVPVI